MIKPSETSAPAEVYQQCPGCDRERLVVGARMVAHRVFNPTLGQMVRCPGSLFLMRDDHGTD